MQRGLGIDFDEYIDMVVSGKESWYGVKPQTNWIKSKIVPAGALTFIRHERFEHQVMYFLGAQGYKLPKRIPWMRKTSGREKDYKEYYTSSARRRVAKFYRNDLDILNYKFGRR
jgi:hypothetical protein